MLPVGAWNSSCRTGISGPYSVVDGKHVFAADRTLTVSDSTPEILIHMIHEALPSPY